MDESTSPLSNPITAFGLPAIFALFMAFVSLWVPSVDTQGPEAIEQSAPSSSENLPTSLGLVSLSNGLWGDPFQNRSKARAEFELRVSIKESERGDEKLTGMEGSGILQNLLAKLSNVEAKKESEPREQKTKQERYSDILQRLLKNGNLLVMPIVVGGESDNESVKDRLKYRHAVEHALAVEEFSMEFPERMSFCMAKKLVIPKAKSKITHDACIPIKLYVKKLDEGQSKAVLVCWIDRRLLGDKPIEVIEQIVGATLELNDSTNDLKASIAVIGPKYSEELEKVKVELETYNTVQKSWVSNLRIYSPTATIGAASSNNETETKIVKSTIGTNSELITSIYKELDLRQRLSGQVVIFSEANASSPNDLKTLFVDKLVKLYGNDKEAAAKNNFVFEYLKGFGNDVGASQQSKTNDYLLRRLQSLSSLTASQATGEELARNSVSAVGFFGNRVRDKLALMKVSRQLFPNATFFTTDMYHEYLLSTNAPDTRGLLVASPYPLIQSIENTGSKEDGFKKISSISFRDSYQASVHNAVTYAIERHLQPEKDAEEIIRPKPQVLEIGYNQSTNLTHFDKPSKGRWLQIIGSVGIAALLATISVVLLLPFFEPVAKQVSENQESLLLVRFGKTILLALDKQLQLFFPEIALACSAAFLANIISTKGDISCWIGLVLAGTIGAVFAVAPCHRKTNSLSRSKERNWILIRLILCCILTLALLVHPVRFNEGSEPLSFTAGTSIWPSLFFLTIMISFSFRWMKKVGEDGLPWKIVPSSFEKILPFSTRPFDFLPDEMQDRPVNFSAMVQLGIKGDFKGQDDSHLNNLWSRLSFTILNFSRLLVTTVVLCLLISEFDWTSFQPNKTLSWAFLPTPPARGGFAITLGMFIHALAILMVLHVSAIALAQLLALRRFIEMLSKHLHGVNDPNPHKILCLFKICKELQSLTHQSSKGLWGASALVLLFAIGRLPFWDSWHLNYSTIMIVVVIPFLFSLPFAIHLRNEASSLRTMLTSKLAGWEMDCLAGKTNDEHGEAMTADGREMMQEQIESSKKGILGLNRGAFGTIWQDPLLGSILMIATSVFTGPGKSIVNHFADLLA